MNGIEYELQVAILQRLKDSPIVTAPIYDDLPDVVTYPYISIDEITALPYKSKTFNGLEVSAVLSVLTDRGGQGANKKHIASIRAALAKPLSLREGHIIHAQEFESARVLEHTIDEAPLTSIKQGIVTFRFKIREGGAVNETI